MSKRVSTPKLRFAKPQVVQNHIERIQTKVRKAKPLRPVVGGSKTALSGAGNMPLKKVAGVLEYDPQEYTFTALAGTPLQKVKDLLAQKNQYLPFDPPLAAQGATLGGTVAAGLSGPGRYRFGGVRDFLLGVRFVSGTGQLVTGGGKVVKNAAGFDFPKLMVGSLGQFGVMVELTFKVFPLPERYATLHIDMASTAEVVITMNKLAMAPFELSCLELLPPARLSVRVGGLAEALPERLERILAFVHQSGEVLEGDSETAFWEDSSNFNWLPEGHSLVKIPLNPQAIIKLEGALATLGASTPRRYSVGGNVLWLGWPDSLAQKDLDILLIGQNLGALALTGSWHYPLLGKRRGHIFEERLRSVLDPNGLFRLNLKET